MKQQPYIVKTVVILVVVVSLFCLLTSLLASKTLDQGYYMTGFLGVLLVGVALHFSDRLHVLDLKNMRVVLSEMRQVKEDIFAKTEVVQSLAEDVADIAVTVGTDRIPQLMPIHLLEERFEREHQRLRMRDKVMSIRRAAGVSDEAIDADRRAFNESTKSRLVVLMKDWLWSNAYEFLLACEKTDRKVVDGFDRDSATDEYERLRQEFQKSCDARKPLHEYAKKESVDRVIDETNCDTQQLRDYLQQNGIWDKKNEQFLDWFDAFVEEHELDGFGGLNH